MTRSTQLYLFQDHNSAKPEERRTGTFTDNMKLPVHRWFRYSAGFSADWAEAVIASYEDRTAVVLDPFAGSGTTIIAAAHKGVDAIGVEAHPFVARIAQAKLHYTCQPSKYRERIRSLVQAAEEVHKTLELDFSTIPTLLRKSYSEDAFRKLESLRLAWEEQDDTSPVSELVWLTITAVLRTTSHAGTAPWQYVLPKKTKAKVVDPFDAIELQSHMMARDMVELAQNGRHSSVRILKQDARTLEGVNNDSIDLVITSPPYANNYDYADATRLEMTFWREVVRWSDLQNAARQYLIRSSTQHVAAEDLDLDAILEDELLAPIRAELASVCNELAEERYLHGGKKPYHLMVAAYFADMARVWKSLRRVCKESAEVCFVLGDSAPYGIYVPVITWHAQLAEAAGFPYARFSKIRDRNIKWQNRTHTVLLTEGELWLTPDSQGEFHVDEKGSPGHKLGQMIGNFFEEFFEESLEDVAKSHSLYLDKRGLRPGVRGKRTKVTWIDQGGTPHDLDYVFERGGTASKLGKPVAFIESAWRRYTKHSRNKAGEIEGALIHLGHTFPGSFLGAIVGGEWSPRSLEQMEARGINVLHVTFEDIIDTFATVNIDLRYAEKATDAIKWQVVEQWSRLTPTQLDQLKAELRSRIGSDYYRFLSMLEKSFRRHVTEVRIWYLFGQQEVYVSVKDAIQSLAQHLEPTEANFVKYEIKITFSNGDKIECTFHEQRDALDFLLQYQ